MDQTVETPQARALPEPPRNDSELGRMEDHMGKIMRRIDALIATENNKVAKIEKKRDERVAQLRQQLKELGDAIYEYAKTHQERLTDKGESKTFHTSGGSIRWAESRWSVAITGAVEEVVARLKSRSKRLIRVKEEPNKEVILEQRELLEARPIKGVSFVKKALFYITPRQTQSALIRDIKEGTWEFSTPAKKKS